MDMRILYANPSKEFGREIVKFLRHAGYAVCCISKPSAISIYRRNHVNLALLEHSQGHPSNSYLAAFRSQGFNWPLIFLDATGDVMAITYALEYIACDFLSLPCNMAELLFRIRCRMHLPALSCVIAYADLTLDFIGRKVKRGERQITLSPSEFNLLAFFMARHDSLISQEVILKQVWQYNCRIKTNIIAAMISRLNRKICSHNEDLLIHNVYGKGYMMTCFRVKKYVNFREVKFQS